MAPPFLPSKPDGDEWPDSRPGRFIPGKEPPSTHLIGGWVGCGVEKNPLALPGIEFRPPRRIFVPRLDKQKPPKILAALTGLKQAKGFLQGPFVKRTKELSKQKPVMLGDRTTHRTPLPER
jgi:hypothetical protein